MAMCPTAKAAKSEIAKGISFPATFSETPRTGAMNAKEQGPSASPKTRPRKNAGRGPLFLRTGFTE